MPPSKITALVAFILLAYVQPAIAAKNDSRDVAAIQEIVEKFRTSIISKDKETFVSLFYSENPKHVIWQLVTDDARVARIQETEPEAVSYTHLQARLIRPRKMCAATIQ